MLHQPRKLLIFLGYKTRTRRRGSARKAKSDRTPYALERHNVAALASEVKNYLGPISVVIETSGTQGHLAFLCGTVNMLKPLRSIN